MLVKKKQLLLLKQQKMEAMIDFTDLNRVRNNYTDADFQILTEVKNIVDAIIPVKECWVDACTQKWTLAFVFDRELEAYDVDMINSSVPMQYVNILIKDLLFTTKSNFKSAYFEIIKK